MTASAQWQPFTLIGACFIYRPWACYYMVCVENIIIMPADVVKRGALIIGVVPYHNLVQQEHVSFDGGHFVGISVHFCLFYVLVRRLTLQQNQFLHEEAVEIVRWLGGSRIRHNTVLVRPTLEQPHVHVDDLVVQPAAGD